MLSSSCRVVHKLKRGVQRFKGKVSMDPMNVRFEYQGNDYEEFVKSKPIPEKRFLLKVRKNIGKEKIIYVWNLTESKTN